jgi:dienelactone hydrolase
LARASGVNSLKDHASAEDILAAPSRQLDWPGQVLSGGISMLRKMICALAVAAAALAGAAQARPPLEAFGDQPVVRSAELSPDGAKVAYIQRIEGVDVLAIYDFATQRASVLARIENIRARDIGFAGDNHVILRVSRTDSAFGVRNRFETSAAFAVNLTTKRIIQLLSRTENIYPYQSGLGRILGVNPNGQHVYMPAFMGLGGEPSYDLLRVDLDSGRGLRAGGEDGNANTIDYLMDGAGNVIAREDFSEARGVHEVFGYANGRRTRIYSEETRTPSTSIIGVSRRTGALMTLQHRDSEFLSLYEMNITNGAVTGPIATRPDADVDDLVTDENRVVHGVRYSGLQPSYEMFDAQLNREIQALATALPNTAISIDSWSRDWSKILLFVQGGAQPQRYMLFDRAQRKLTTIVNSRPEITPADVGEVVGIKYPARDGLQIPAILTWPAGVTSQEARRNLPMVVLPHGGPEAYDSIGFDWLAQYIANQGYLVLQPNFRGSEGFGAVFREAGRQQWGRKMQDDITDGVAALARMGWADRGRVCIVGWSYGGYAALAGGSLTPDTYKCVASIAGVSDLTQMLNYERTRFGPNSLTYNYWRMIIGDPGVDAERREIERVSPARHAEDFRVPVLLIHGAEDTTVPIAQSERMNSALRSAGKSVTYIRINGDDHGLVDNDSRRQTLTALGEFLATHLGPGASPTAAAPATPAPASTPSPNAPQQP